MGDQTDISPHGGLGRPASFVREEAVDAAMHLFWKKGFLAVSAKDLADAMGIQRSSFYNSFGTREAVFMEALRRYAAQAPDAPLDAVAPGQLVVPVLVSTFREICRVRAADAEARGCLVCNGIAELVGLEESVGPVLEEALRHRIVGIQRLLHQAVQQREVVPFVDELAAARALVAFLIGLNTISKVVRNERDLWKMCYHFLIGLGVTEASLGQGGSTPKRKNAR